MWCPVFEFMRDSGTVDHKGRPYASRFEFMQDFRHGRPQGRPYASRFEFMRDPDRGDYKVGAAMGFVL